MKRVNTVGQYDLYMGIEPLNKRMRYNIVPKGDDPPENGYFSAEFIAKKFKVSPSFFFTKR